MIFGDEIIDVLRDAHVVHFFQELFIILSWFLYICAMFHDRFENERVGVLPKKSDDSADLNSNILIPSIS
jgi:hypothetical protein